MCVLARSLTRFRKSCNLLGLFSSKGTDSALEVFYVLSKEEIHRKMEKKMKKARKKAKYILYWQSLSLLEGPRQPIQGVTPGSVSKLCNQKI